MHAAVINEYNSIEWQQVEFPLIGNEEVLVKVTFASICGTDEHIFSGEFHPRTQLPLIPGHEFAGIIEKTGAAVSGFIPGEKVAVDPVIWCGKCDACISGHYPACNSLKLIGVDLNGGFAEYISLPFRMLHKVPPGVDDKHASLVELLSVGFHACNRAGVKQDDSIVIWGAGKVGHAILQAARTITKNRIILIDLLTERLNRAKMTYPDINVIRADKNDPVQEINRLTEGKGVDIAFEAVGHAHLDGHMIHPVRGCIQVIRGGGTVCVLGLAAQPAPLMMKELIWKEAKIISSRVSHGEYKECLHHLSEGNLNPGSLISSILPASEAQKAFELLKTKPEEHLKILLQFC